MSNNVFAKFDKEFDVKGLKEDLKNISSNSAEYKEVPFGTYEVKIEKLELVESKTGKPMVSCWMRILEGEYKNSMLFMNQVIHTPYGLHMANEFLRSLESCIEVEFESFTQYHNMLLNIHEAIDETYEYAVEYGETKKGFKTFKIVEVFEVE
ncbi:Protein of unknown function [Caminicella sporogenes DSM 14501]|uniref:DUF669 domain-containing protein n=1 Tax=Caminicella sporogenes DSM 14501 TaxID=1121266 RepID=A0A1M6RGI8_9FIRM|nr:DUF669 domain-containing protein [Caminicella sporogenes]RKD25228.1 hypothetical protein BET04_03155 [Caminicella sporogenes]SHK31584.1 Protein of unknown function [Caminicella sporogenes DSM 14501]